MKPFKQLLLFPLLAMMMLYISCDRKQAQEEASDVYYTCSMDPQVMERKPGRCPICKMELTKTIVSPEENQESIKLSETQIKLGNVRTVKAGEGTVGEGISLRGTLVPDERKVNVITARVPGRVDRLYFKSQGQKIGTGDHVYDIYSEELQAAIDQYLLLKEKTLKLHSGNVNYEAMLKSARDKLMVWGMTPKQISSLSRESVSSLVPFYSPYKGVAGEIRINEGDYVNEGSPVIEVADYSALWVEAEVYPKDMEAVKPGMKVKVAVDAFPDETIEGVITFENPELRPGSEINLVRIEISNKEGKYKPGMRANVTAFYSEGRSLTVPESAILYQPEMKMVWVEKEPGLFVPRMVETGITGNGQVAVTSGLAGGESVVVSGAYLIDSEYRLRKGSGDMPGMDHGKHEEATPAGHQH